jgi:hypothetical protein
MRVLHGGEGIRMRQSCDQSRAASAVYRSTSEHPPAHQQLKTASKLRQFGCTCTGACRGTSTALKPPSLRRHPQEVQRTETVPHRRSMPRVLAGVNPSSWHTRHEPIQSSQQSQKDCSATAMYRTCLHAAVTLPRKRRLLVAPVHSDLDDHSKT